MAKPTQKQFDAMREQIGPPAKLTINDKERWAWQLRIGGYSQDQIGQLLGYRSSDGVATAIKRYQAKHIDVPAMDVEALVQLELARLDALLVALQPGIDAGESDAVRAAVQISAARRQLLGLDAPTKHATLHIGPDGKSVELVRLNLPEADIVEGAVTVTEEGDGQADC